MDTLWYELLLLGYALLEDELPGYEPLGDGDGEGDGDGDLTISGFGTI
jgi:hypothetical protein